MSAAGTARFVRVTCRAPCAVCGRSSYCTITADGTLAYCMRVSEGSVRRARNGAFVHLLAPSTSARSTTTRPFHQTEDETRADDDYCNLVYRALLESLTLTPAHAEHLAQTRGLSPETIAANLYASVPAERQASSICDDLTRCFRLEGVPGFYRESFTALRGCREGCAGDELADGRWRLNTRYAPGIIVPVRDVAGRIVGAQIRRDSGDGAKYIWLSSAGMPSGTSARASIHFARPDLARISGYAVVIEGVLKADIVSEFMQCAVVGLPGANAFPTHIGQMLRAYIPELQSVAVAYDADYRTNLHVGEALLRLVDALESAGLCVLALKWNPAHGKGLDDLLLRESEAHV